MKNIMIEAHASFGKWLGFILAFYALFYSQFTFAAVEFDAAKMLQQLSTAVPNLMHLVTAFAYVAGMFILMKGVLEFKHFGETRSMYSRDRSFSGPLMYLAVGSALLYLPSAVSVGTSTFWTNPSPYGYIFEEGNWFQFFRDCFLIVQLIGTIAFIKGLMLLSHLAGSSSSSGAGKGITHIIGGIFCINLYAVIETVFVTFGISKLF